MSNLGEAVYMVEGDTARFICELENTDITGYSFRFLARLEDGTRITKTGTIVDAPNGGFLFSFAAGELLRGEHEFEIEITDTASNIQTIPPQKRIPLRVRADVA